MRFKLSAIIFFFLTFLFGFFSPAFVQAADAYQITGTVTDHNGNGVENVSVTATDPGGSTVQFGPSFTSGDGSYQLDVNAGTYDIHFTSASGSGLNPIVYSNFTVLTNQVLNIVLVPTTYTFSGSVHYQNGDPVVGASIAAIGSNGSWSGSTNGSGQFSFTLQSGVYQVRVVKSWNNGGSSSQVTYDNTGTIDLTTSGATRDFELPNTASLTVVTRDSNGNPVTVPVYISNGGGSSTVIAGDASIFPFTYDGDGYTGVFTAPQPTTIGSICAVFSTGQICHSGSVNMAAGDVTIIFQPQSSTPTPTPTPANVAPVVGAISATVNPVQVFTVTGATASFTDINISDTHTAVWDWGDGTTSPGDVTESNGSGSVSGSHVYLAAGVYEVILTVTDNNNASDSEVFQYLSVYNPTPQGLFSGARIFTSPQGAYVANPNLSGQVKFGVTAKYQNNEPTGNVSMNFKDADFEFESTTLTVLVTSNGEATLRGTGTVNGTGSYTFLVTGIDGADDAVRFQIKDASNNVVYDSQMGAADTADPTASVTGQVIIH